MRDYLPASPSGMNFGSLIEIPPPFFESKRQNSKSSDWQSTGTDYYGSTNDRRVPP
jgi:hypothetical protein